MFRLGLAATAVGVLVAQLSSGVLAQTPDPPFIARAKVSVANNSPVPQTAAGTSVAPFQLPPHQPAELNMSVVPPPAPTAPGSSIPVQFEYSVGQSPGPQCHGTIEMSLSTQRLTGGIDEVTNCVAHSLGTDGAQCQIVVKAQNAACQGGLAFSAG